MDQPRPHPLAEILRRVGRACARQYADYAEHCERRSLRERPWREDLLHFTPDGQLHGHLLPAAGRRAGSTTSSGWCSGLREP